MIIELFSQACGERRSQNSVTFCDECTKLSINIDCKI